MEQRVKQPQAKTEILETRIKEWGIDLEKFRATAAKAQGQAKVRLDSDVAALQVKLNDAQRKLAELKKTGVAATGELQKGVEAAWASLESAFDKAKAKFE